MHNLKYIIGIIILIYVIFKLSVYLKSKKTLLNECIEIDENQFHIKGNEDKFIIKKNDRFEFIVKDGKIIASRDNIRHKKFKYYEED
ncbi:hypothetical protein [Paraclostridium bifermentans]|uniref:hypothetical protein n=1 Tax=Paraclostridium bifermentans TaxID=1490 RepID=UPI00115B9ECB|nr:hypothetical protein [Paraclostridium bifermentans]MCE9674411.1 hypothetical protein [Paraclostridium bifermentans]TQO58119.1 hypothetical protein D5S05_09290 [Paraclostridium bifermentans]